MPSSLSLPHTAIEARKNERRRDEWEDRNPPASPPPPPFFLSSLSLSLSRATPGRPGTGGVGSRCDQREHERCKEELCSLVDLRKPEVTPEASKQKREKKREKQDLINGGGE